MQRNLVSFFVLTFFILEGTIVHWLIPDWEVRIAPHLVLVAVVYIALYLNRHLALLYGLIFGMLQGIIFYGHMVGAYSFGMGLTGYLAGLIFRRFHLNIASTLFIITLSNLLFDMILYGLYRLFGITELAIQWVFVQQIIPSLMINLLFALLIYIPVRSFLEPLNFQHKGDEEE